MLSRNTIKNIRNLRDARSRREQKLFVAEGEKVIRELIRSGWKYDMIYHTGDLPVWLIDEELSDKCRRISEKEMSRISNLRTNPGLLAVVMIPPASSFKESVEPVLVLDRISDPGNMGTIIRTADWFGVRQLICSEDSVDVYNPKVVQATMGSLFRVNVFYRDLQVFISNRDNNREIYAAVTDGEPIKNVSAAKDAVLILGNESAGISHDLLELASRKVSIPPHTEKVESLNVSVAGGILLNWLVNS